MTNEQLSEGKRLSNAIEEKQEEIDNVAEILFKSANGSDTFQDFAIVCKADGSILLCPASTTLLRGMSISEVLDASTFGGMTPFDLVTKYHVELQRELLELQSQFKSL